MAGNSVPVEEIESIVRKAVLEEMEQVTKRVTLTIFKHFNVTSRTSLDQAETSEGRGYQLRFADKLPPIIFTDSKIEAEIGGPVKIVLIDTISNGTVTSGPLSSIKIQILVLDGDFEFEAQGNWTEQDFNDKVVHEREGKRPLVTGGLNIMLRDGVGIINDLSFTDNSSWIKCRKFRLGATVVQSIGGQVSIKEAISEAFVVKDQRAEVYKKNHPPSLGDEVWRLEKIAKDGKYHSQLASLEIQTVQDFLRMYVTDPITLRKKLGCSNRAWDTIVKHASTCGLNDEIFYTYSGEGIGLLFNSVYKLVAATFDGQNYQFLDDPTFTHKLLDETIKKQGYRNVNNFVQVDRQAIFGPSNPLISLQAEPYNSPTSGLQHPEFPVAHAGSEEMQINCYHVTTSSSSMVGLGNHSHQSQLHVAQNTHLPQAFDYPMFGSYNLRMDELSPIFNGEIVPNIASEMTSQAPMPTWSPVNATWEHNNGFNLPSTSNESEFEHVANTHGMQQVVNTMSTRSPLSATRENINGMSMPISKNSEYECLSRSAMECLPDEDTLERWECSDTLNARSHTLSSQLLNKAIQVQDSVSVIFSETINLTGSAEMQIDCYHATISSSSMGGLGNHSHQSQLHVAQNTLLPQAFDYPMFGSCNSRMDELSSIFNGGIVPNIASEMTSQAPMPTWSPVNATWEHNNGFILPSTSNDSEFGHVANTHVNLVFSWVSS